MKQRKLGSGGPLVAAVGLGCMGMSAGYGDRDVSPATLRATHAVHPITAVQLEYSLFTRDVVEGPMRATCQELGIAVIAYSPVGRGMLAGAVASRDQLGERDWRRTSPRFSDQNFGRNLALVEAVRAVAAEIGCTPAQAALAWVLAQGEDVVAIPGRCATWRRTRRPVRWCHR